MLGPFTTLFLYRKRLLIWFFMRFRVHCVMINAACVHFNVTQTKTKILQLSLTLSLPQSSIDDLVFSVFSSNFFKLSYKISLLKNRFVTLFFI